MFEKDTRWQKWLNVLGVLFVLSIILILVWQRNRTSQRIAGLAPDLLLPAAHVSAKPIQNIFASVGTEQQLWLAGDTGLHIWQGTTHTTLSDPNPEQPAQMQALAITEKPNMLWVGTLNQGLWQWDGDSWRQPVPIQNNAIYKVQPTANSDLWLASAQGVLHWQDTTLQHYAVPTGSPPSPVFDLALAADGTPWVIHSSGLYQWQPTANQFTLAAPASLFPAPLTSLFFDQQQQLWVGFLGGIASYQQQQWQQWQPAALRNQPITAFWADDSNTVFIATGQGVWYWQTDSLALLPATETLTVRTINPHPQGGLWLGSNNGLWHWQAEQLSAVK
jgi:ligand-binding sensor domain-containing protein